jgi:3-oxoacyl-[acyl-carrier protein] reductase
VLGLAAEGVRVCIAARRPELLKNVADEVVARGGATPVTVAIDVAQRHAPARLAAQALAELGHVDILVNWAGGGRPLAIDAPEEAWDEAMMLGFVSRRQLTQALLPGMMERKWGRIINITGGTEPTKINAGFSGKAALQAWGKGLSREIGKYGVTINSIPPGRILSEQSLRRYPEPERKAFAQREIPLERFGEPEEVAALAVFVASEIAGYITGAVLPVDGGMRRYAF